MEVLRKIKISRPLKTEGHVLIRDHFGKVTAKESYDADFIFYRNVRLERNPQQVVSRRIDNLDKAFDKLLEVAGVDGLIFKDL